MKDELRLTDAVLAAFCLQSGEGKKLPELIKMESIYTAFSELSKKYDSELRELYFAQSPAQGIPVSSRLEDILFSLGAKGLATIENPEYKYFSIKPEKCVLIKEQIKARRAGPQRQRLQSLADDFAKMVTE